MAAVCVNEGKAEWPSTQTAVIQSFMHAVAIHLHAYAIQPFSDLLTHASAIQTFTHEAAIQSAIHA